MSLASKLSFKESCHVIRFAGLMILYCLGEETASVNKSSWGTDARETMQKLEALLASSTTESYSFTFEEAEVMFRSDSQVYKELIKERFGAYSKEHDLLSLYDRIYSTDPAKI